MSKEIKSIQEWIPFEKILDNGIIKIKENKYIKIIKIIPINFNLKSELEKQSILNSYKIFLKTCNFNIQILIQSKKEDLQNQILKIQENLKTENKLNEISSQYINYIQKINSIKNSSSKNFFLIISNSENTNKNNLEETIEEELNEKYFKIKECLARCGNYVINYSEKEEVEKIIYSFLNTRIFLK